MNESFHKSKFCCRRTAYISRWSKLVGDCVTFVQRVAISKNRGLWKHIGNSVTVPFWGEEVKSLRHQALQCSSTKRGQQKSYDKIGRYLSLVCHGLSSMLVVRASLFAQERLCIQRRELCSPMLAWRQWDVIVVSTSHMLGHYFFWCPRRSLVGGRAVRYSSEFSQNATAYDWFKSARL